MFIVQLAFDSWDSYNSERWGQRIATRRETFSRVATSNMREACRTIWSYWPAIWSYRPASRPAPH
eukprot:4135041-Pyramimonas_sp.AAC.1